MDYKIVVRPFPKPSRREQALMVVMWVVDTMNSVGKFLSGLLFFSFMGASIVVGVAVVIATSPLWYLPWVWYRLRHKEPLIGP